jgi:hypothetical protein
MSDEKTRQELFHTLCWLIQRYPSLRLCQLICNSIPPEELARRNNDLYYIEDADLLSWLRSFDQKLRESPLGQAPVNPIKRIGPDPAENPVEWCSVCKQQVVREPGEEGCPLCSGATMEMGDYIDAIYETYRDRS